MMETLPGLFLRQRLSFNHMQKGDGYDGEERIADWEGGSHHAGNRRFFLHRRRRAQEAIFFAQACGAKLVVLHVIAIDAEAEFGAHRRSVEQGSEQPCG
jgi:hypothetical protein